MAIQDFSGYDPEQPMYCANHPTVQTYLRCSNCGKPICAKCRVSTPAGFKCFQCANLQVLPTYAVSTDYYVKSAAAGLGAAAIIGILMGVFPAFEFWAALLMGIGVPEAVTAAANQKRGPGLRTVAVVSVLFGFFLSRVVMRLGWWQAILLGGVNKPQFGGISFLDNSSFFVNQYTLLWLAMALFFAIQRLK
ncbi:MAG TPA: hypothetical protein VLQ48_07510 [Chloroflexia bacterium]|nr:hypothetical protein [Chloroflexia bacterium]